MRQLNMFTQDKINKHQSELNSYNLKWLLGESEEDACEILTTLAEADIYPYSVFKGSRADWVWKQLLLIDRDFDCDVDKSLIKDKKELQAFLKIAFSLGLYIFYIARRKIKALWWTKSNEETPASMALEIAGTTEQSDLEFPSLLGLPGDDWKDYGLDTSDWYGKDGDFLDTGDDMNGFAQMYDDVTDFLDYTLDDCCEEITCPLGVISDPNKNIKLPGPIKI